MRSIIISFLLVSSLGACATVSMVASEAVVETELSAEESSLRKVSDAYTDLAERKNWIAKNTGLLGFARVLMEGSDKTEAAPLGSYSETVLQEAPLAADQLVMIREDIESAAHGLDVATMEVNKLFGIDLKARALRADQLSYESALITAKKARRTFVATLSDLEIGEANSTAFALARFDSSIDAARDAADLLADYAANRKRAESIS